MKRIDAKEDFGGFEVEHEANYIGILNIGHNQRLCQFSFNQTDDFKLKQAQFLVDAANAIPKISRNIDVAITILEESTKQSDLDEVKRLLKSIFN